MAVDRRDDSVWVALWGSAVRKYDSSGTLLLDIPADAFTLAVDQSDGSVWVGGTSGDLARYAEDGTPIDFIARGFGSVVSTRIALPSFCAQ